MIHKIIYQFLRNDRLFSPALADKFGRVRLHDHLSVWRKGCPWRKLNGFFSFFQKRNFSLSFQLNLFDFPLTPLNSHKFMLNFLLDALNKQTASLTTDQIFLSSDLPHSILALLRSKQVNVCYHFFWVWTKSWTFFITHSSSGIAHLHFFKWQRTLFLLLNKKRTKKDIY